MSFTPGEYQGFTAADYNALLGLATAASNNTLLDFLNNNFQSAAGGAFYIMSNGDPYELLELMEDVDTSSLVYGLTMFEYLKSTWSMTGTPLV